MSTTYLAVFESDGRRVDREVLLAALRADWPHAVLQDASPWPSEVRDVHWTQARTEAWANADGTCLYLAGEIGLVAEFAVWWRRLVPADVEVIFCDEGYNFDFPITPDMTPAGLDASIPQRWVASR
ncbi:hypothetical protein [Lentzea aerocolonigenes]|uniref:hypothetical protein n=1 Tax=Lentzea aerocolonigenes TaxID=68170 RepID=UPI0005EC3D94|nr:hypothetical protein [Lentzea aerocolonigenes]